MDAKKELEKIGSLYTGHFVGVSTKHLAGYCNLDPLFPRVSIVKEFVKEMVSSFAGKDIDTVASPAIGAIPLSHWGAHFLSELNGKNIYGVWADKVSGSATKEFKFERQGFKECVNGKKVLLIEDMINQMATIKSMIKTVREAGGEVVGVCAIAANRGVSAEALEVPKFVKLTSVEFDTWTKEECAINGLCSKNVPIVEDIGHGDDFKKENPNYPGGYIKLLK